MATMIDTLKVFRTLEGAGLPKLLAEAVASSIADAVGNAREDLVTKDYLRGELAAQKNDLVRWLLGSQVALVVILAALANFTKAFG